MFWNALFHPVPYYTAPTTPNSRLLTPLVYLYWAVICCVLLPLAPIYLFASLLGTIYISTQMGWRLKQTKPEVTEDSKKRYLVSVSVTPVTEPVPITEPTPVAEPAPPAESPPVVESASVAGSVPVVETAVAVGVVEEKEKSEDEPGLTIEEGSSVKPHEFTPTVHEEVQTESPIREIDEEIPQALAEQEPLTMTEYTSPTVAGLLEDVEENCGMMESKSTTESAPSDYSESTSSDIEESDEDELGEKKHKEEPGLDEITEEEGADEEILRRGPDEREASDQELTPQAPEYIPPAQVKPEEPVFVPAPRVYGPPAFGICEKRGVREIVDPRERHSHQTWIQQPVSVSMEETLTSSDESSPYDDESERDGSPPVSPISSVGGTGNWGGIIESLDKIVELEIGAEKTESVRDDDTSVKPTPLAAQKAEIPKVSEVPKAPAMEAKKVLLCVAPVEPTGTPTAAKPEKQATTVDESKLMPVVETAPKLERSNTNDSGFESGSVKEAKVQKKKKAPMKQRLGNKRGKRSW
ncbi:hypothetical protein C7212DRAFT_311253 [Tuber magnatum]|uniref:Uncharacterized protein n=1 Tax=Tuber magnatum TaxID=42249 RepID=A0A317T0Q1_9PEZI|nr:hypothetical protein C7212DRAFT_311253 [Tuber magnatum]